MLNLQERKALLGRMREYLLSEDATWLTAKQEAGIRNAWFIPSFVDIAVNNIANELLAPERLQQWTEHYEVADRPAHLKNIGIVMAGNIPLVGFHDFLSVFASGHIQTIKLSSSDNLLLPSLVRKMYEWNPNVSQYIRFAEMLKDCDAYIATGSNNSSNYFQAYFGKYPNIIRKNRSSVAILSGTETTEQISALAKDVHLYFGLGCRNVTKLYVPQEYDFQPLLENFKTYDFLLDNHKYKHNYDYNLTIQIINQRFYMTNGTIILTENPSIFSPISQLHFQYYQTRDEIFSQLNPGEVQAIVGIENTAFGTAQQPSLFDYADGIDTMQFLKHL